MAEQRTFAMAAGFEKHHKITRRSEFLSAMNTVVPWAELCGEIEPFYPKAGNGRRPVGLERMLRMYFLQHWFNLPDPAVEEALYDSHAMRQFVGIDLGHEPVPDETTVLKFRHLLERHGLGAKIFARVNSYLASHGLKVGTGTIVDATILAAPSSTKNKSGQRDPEMHQTRKGNEWHFGMKAHVGVDAETKLVHTVERNRLYSKVRSRVEHVFGTLKLRFGFAKVRYRGLAKNLHRLQVSFALVNLVTAQKHLAMMEQ